MNEAGWWALYSKPRHEKKLADLLNERGIEAYTPVRKVLKQWSDRKKWVEEPLIRSYTFVRAEEQYYFDALNTHGAVRYVWFSGKAATIPNRQINILKAIVGSDLEVDTITTSLKPGSMVKVMAGPLIGTVGELVSIAGNKKVIIRIDHLETVLSVTISPLLLEKLPDPTPDEKREREERYKRFW
ncbi:MAG: UpxY family transcription antiterminator [Bacteroidales bacterium]|nr:UpxY family transcription antiterminator [Bacteroidales bacterium]